MIIHFYWNLCASEGRAFPAKAGQALLALAPRTASRVSVSALRVTILNAIFDFVRDIE